VKIRARLCVDELEQRVCCAPVVTLPDGTDVIILSPASVVILPPLVTRRPPASPARRSPPRGPSEPRRDPPPRAPVKPAPFRELGRFLILYLPAVNPEEEECWFGWDVELLPQKPDNR